MSEALDVKNLPYDLVQKSTNVQLGYLCELLSIPKALAANGGKQEVRAMVGTILYRHLDVVGRRNAMEAIRSVHNRALEGKLVTLALDTTFVNPQWGMWSLTNEELLRDRELHKSLEDIAGKIGVTMSAISLFDAMKKFQKTGRVGPDLLVTVVIWGALAVNHGELEQAESEIKRRTKTELRVSPFY